MRLTDLTPDLVATIVGFAGVRCLPTVLRTCRRWAAISRLLWQAVRDVQLAPREFSEEQRTAICTQLAPVRCLTLTCSSASAISSFGWLAWDTMKNLRVLIATGLWTALDLRVHAWLPRGLEYLAVARVRAFELIDCPQLKGLSAGIRFTSPDARAAFLARHPRPLPRLERLCCDDPASLLPVDWSQVPIWYPALESISFRQPELAVYQLPPLSDPTEGAGQLRALDLAGTGAPEWLLSLVTAPSPVAAPSPAAAWWGNLRALGMDVIRDEPFDIALLPRTLTALELNQIPRELLHLAQLPAGCALLRLSFLHPLPSPVDSEPLPQVRQLKLQYADRICHSGGDGDGDHLARWQRWLPVVFPRVTELDLEISEDAGGAAREWCQPVRHLPELRALDLGWLPDSPCELELGDLQQVRSLAVRRCALQLQGSIGATRSWTLDFPGAAHRPGPSAVITQIADTVESLCLEGDLSSAIAWLEELFGGRPRGGRDCPVFPALRTLTLSVVDHETARWRAWHHAHRHRMPHCELILSPRYQWATGFCVTAEN